MRISALAVVTLAILTWCATQLQADSTSLRCGNSLVSLGDTMYKVRRKCGDPQNEQSVGEKRSYKIHEQEQYKIEEITYIVEWIYEKDLGEYILTFEGNRLVRKEYAK